MSPTINISGSVKTAQPSSTYLPILGTTNQFVMTMILSFWELYTYRVLQSCPVLHLYKLFIIFSFSFVKITKDTPTKIGLRKACGKSLTFWIVPYRKRGPLHLPPGQEDGRPTCCLATSPANGKYPSSASREDPDSWILNFPPRISCFLC